MKRKTNLRFSSVHYKVQESDEEFFSRLKDQFEIVVTIIKRELFEGFIFGDVKPGNSKNESGRAIFEAIPILKKPKVVRNLANTLMSSRTCSRVILLTKYDILRYENEQKGIIG